MRRLEAALKQPDPRRRRIRDPREPDSPRRPRRGARLAACLALYPIVQGCGAPATLKPNLVLITVDSLRPDRLACYGGPDGIGTAICALAGSGVRYGWAFSPSPFTPVAISSIFTSRYPSAHGVTALAASSLPSRAVTLAETLRSGGYATGAFVGNPNLNRSRNLKQGFDIYDDRPSRSPATSGPRLLARQQRTAASLTRSALAFADGATEPWFIWVHYGETRGPYAPLPAGSPATLSGAQAGSRSIALMPLADHSGRGGVPAYQAWVKAVDRSASEIAKPTLNSTANATENRIESPVENRPDTPAEPPEETRAIESGDLLRRYDGEIRRVDQQIGRLVEGLDALGRPGVLVTADHGEALGEDDYWFAHGHSVGLDQIWVPLVWRAPHKLDAPAAARRGSVVREPVSTLDVAPTLLAAAELSRPEEFAGVPLETRPALRATARTRRVFAEHPLRAAVIQDGVYYAQDRPAFEQPVRDRIRGGELHPLPARVAQLRDDGTRTPYALVAGPAPRAGATRAAASHNGPATTSDTAIAGLAASLAEFVSRAEARAGIDPGEAQSSVHPEAPHGNPE